MPPAIYRAAAVIGCLSLAGCEQPQIPLPPRREFPQVPAEAPPRVAEQPVQQAALPIVPVEPLPVPPSPAPPITMAPPTIRWHERLGEEGVKNRQRGMRFRIVFLQSPIDVSTRVSIKDRFGLERQFTSKRDSGLHGLAGIDEFIPNASRAAGPYLVKVEFHDPKEDAWADAVGYEFLPQHR